MGLEHALQGTSCIAPSAIEVQAETVKGPLGWADFVSHQSWDGGVPRARAVVICVFLKPSGGSDSEEEQLFAQNTAISAQASKRLPQRSPVSPVPAVPSQGALELGRRSRAGAGGDPKKRLVPAVPASLALSQSQGFVPRDLWVVFECDEAWRGALLLRVHGVKRMSHCASFLRALSVRYVFGIHPACIIPKPTCMWRVDLVEVLQPDPKYMESKRS